MSLIKILLNRTDETNPWGIRLQGGAEFHEPLIITNIVPNSPADGKVNLNDAVIDISGNNVTNMTHQDVLTLIRHCGNALQLTVLRENLSEEEETKIEPISKEDEPISTNILKEEVETLPEEPSTVEFTSSEQKVSLENAPIYSEKIPIKVMFVETIPVESMQVEDHFSNVYNVPQRDNQFIVGMHNELDMVSESLQSIIETPLNKSATFPHLSELLDRVLSASNKLFDVGETPHPTFRIDPTSSPDSFQSISTMNRRTIIPPEQMDRHHYTNNAPNQPFTYIHQQLIPPKKNIQYDTDAITQSRSFQILQDWISESEKSLPASPMSSQNSSNPLRSNLSMSVTSLPSRSFRYLQEQYKESSTTQSNPTAPTPPSAGTYSSLRRSTDAHTPSRAFRYLQEQLPINRSITVNNREDLMEIYNKTPASIREREHDIPRYRGAAVPSRSFRFLQMMTEENQPKTPQSTSHTNPTHLTTNGNPSSRSYHYSQEMSSSQSSLPMRSMNSSYCESSSSPMENLQRKSSAEFRTSFQLNRSHSSNYGRETNH